MILVLRHFVALGKILRGSGWVSEKPVTGRCIILMRQHVRRGRAKNKKRLPVIGADATHFLHGLGAKWVTTSPAKLTFLIDA